MSSHAQQAQTLVEALPSDTIRTYIEDTFDGAVVPAF